METGMSQQHNFCRRTRREFLWETGAGFTGLALSGMLAQEGFLARQARAADGQAEWVSPMAAKAPQFPAKAKSVIFLFMYGGPEKLTASPPAESGS